MSSHLQDGPDEEETGTLQAEVEADVERAEASALEAEDTACLSPGERAVRKVARMILAALPADQQPETPDMRVVPIKNVEEAIGVGRTAVRRTPT
ncbi:hypothetical protein [Streptomyces sp. bgisy095]|uniref:hypothetical protein n=1 Tax=unclassified Streptomyces TaxID=2593676 RepID=UPI003D72E45A